MKRKASNNANAPSPKRIESLDYCDEEPRRAEDGEIIWPAPKDAIEAARAFLKECADKKEKVLIVPDKDADGLDAGVIIYRTLTALGLDSSSIDIHLVKKGSNIHAEDERQAMKEKDAKFIVVVDQGSRGAPPVVDSPDTKCLIIDHHLSDEFPKDALVVSACHYPPVATASLLTYEICKDLHPTIKSTCSYLCAMGTHGDLGTSLKWKPPFPDMTETFRTHSKKSINDAVSLVNAPRRTAKYDVISAWTALLNSTTPKDLLSNTRLIDARFEINQQVERQTHTPPRFSKDGKIAVLRIHSAAQVHPVIATRWAGFLKSRTLEIILVANSGYLPENINFSCRIAKCARNKDPPVNIIASLKDAANLADKDLIGRMGESFARGHKEASGGIVPVQEFEELMGLLGVGEKAEKADIEVSLKKQKVTQKNNLMNYFSKG